MRWLLTTLLLAPLLAWSQPETEAVMPAGDAERGRLVFGSCRTCHYPDAFMGHNYGPNLSRIFGKVAGKQEGFEYYSETFKQAEFVWTPQMLFLWLADPLAMFPDTTMMARPIADPQARADLIAYLVIASQRGDDPKDTETNDD